MLTIDDANTIMEKYGETGFLYELDFNKIPSITAGKTYHYDFCDITLTEESGYGIIAEVEVVSSLKPHPLYIKKSNGSYATSNYMTLPDPDHFWIGLPNDGDLIIVMYISKTAIPSYNTNILWYRDNGLILPVSPLQIPVVNGEFDNKFYVNVVGSNISSYTINGSAVTLQTDTNGNYLELPSAETCIIGTTGHSESFPLYRVTFREFKTIPNLFIDTLYKGTPQQIKLFNEDTWAPITEFQAYYQGRKLKDNIIELPYDCDDIVDIVIDILDPNYPQSRVKLKGYTSLYRVNSQAGLEEAISDGIQTVQVTNRLTRAVVEYVTLSEMDLTGLNLVDSFIHLIDSTMANVNIIDSEFVDRGNNTITSSIFKDTAISNSDNQYIPNKDISHYNNCTITGCTFAHIGIILTGNITGSTLTNSLIISDGTIEVTGNTFTGKYTKDYFPAQLYLTGDYLVKQNTFTLSGTWSEPAFDMCIIKTIEGFNPSVFVNENSLSLNITYGSEQKDTFYYNIVDDDKIYARRLS